MSTFSGVTTREVIDRIRARVFYQTVAIQFNWMGKGEKYAINDLLVCKAIKAIQLILQIIKIMNNCQNLTIKNVIFWNSVKTTLWFQFSVA